MKKNYLLPSRLFAFCEVIAVFFAGSLIAQLLFQFAGITSHPLAALTGENPDMLAIAMDLTKILLLQFSGWFALIVFFTWMSRQKLNAKLKLTKNGIKLSQLVIIGLLAWCIGDLANKLVFVLDEAYNLGTSAPWREALLSAERTTGWWLVMFVGSFGLIPVLEEIFWRGYVQSKLTEFFSPVVGIVITAVLFVFSHAQYHQLDLFHASTLIALTLCSLVMGWITYKTGSIIPAIIMHALLNFPTDGVFLYILIGLMVSVSAWQWQRIKAFAADLITPESLSNFNLSNLAILIAGIGAMLLLSQAPMVVVKLGVGCLAVAVVVAVVTLVKSQRKTG